MPECFAALNTILLTYSIVGELSMWVLRVEAWPKDFLHCAQLSAANVSSSKFKIQTLQTHTQTNIQTYKHTNTQTHKHTNIQAYKHTSVQTYKHTNIQKYKKQFRHELGHQFRNSCDIFEKVSYFWRVKTAVCKISQTFDDNHWRNYLGNLIKSFSTNFYQNIEKLTTLWIGISARYIIHLLRKLDKTINLKDNDDLPQILYI